MDKEPTYLTPAEAAKLKGVSRTAIYSAIAEGRLPHTRMLGRLALLKRDVMEWIPRQYTGRPKGIAVSEETRARMSEAHKKQWVQNKLNRSLNQPGQEKLP